MPSMRNKTYLKHCLNLAKGLVFSSFVFGFLVFFSADAYAATLDFSPSVVTLSRGEQKTITISLKGDTSGGIIGTDMILLYDPSKVKIIQATNLGVFSRQMALNINNDSGRTAYSIANLYTQPNPTIAPRGDTEIARITIEGVEAGSSQIQFDFTPGDTTDTNVAALGGNDVLTSTRGLIVSSVERLSNEKVLSTRSLCNLL